MENAALIRTLDLGDFTRGPAAKSEAFIQGLKQGFMETGFVFVTNHGLPEHVIQYAFRALPLFFNGLAPEVKLQYELPKLDRQIGYTPPGVETGEHAKIADTKEFWQIHTGRSLYVPQVREFAPALVDLFFASDQTYHTLMRAVALSLDLAPYYFETRKGDSLLRAIHYPAHDVPQDRDEEVERGGNVLGMCASRHTDINMLTLLLAREPGLQLLYKSEWLPVTTSDPNVLIVNCGDMLEHLTGGRYKSGEHRVVCKPGVERFSIPHFGHVSGETSIVPLAHLGKSNLRRFHFKTAGAYLARRLKKIGLAAKK